MTYEPAGRTRADGLSFATPPTSVAVPIRPALSKKLTVPVGVPAPGATSATVAVKVTVPAAAERFDDVSAVVVAAWLTTGLAAVDVLARSFASPPYTAVIEWLATDKLLVVKVAMPPLSVPVPRIVEPSLNVTVPAGVPKPGDGAVTVAVKVTDWPSTDG